MNINVDSILNYKDDPAEDYYNILGCDSSSSTEQIVTEYKLRAKEFHPDKSPDGQKEIFEKKFKQIQEAKIILTDPELRKRYDAWKSAGLAISFKQWMGFKESVKTSMHWATPKTAGRMIQVDNFITEKEGEPVSLKTSPVNDKDITSEYPEEDNDADCNDNVTYDAIPYDRLGYRMSTPPPELIAETNRIITKKTSEPEEKSETQTTNPQKLEKTKSITKESGVEDPKTAMKRKLFAIRRESTIGTMVMAERLDDNEIRRKFRDYEI